MIANSTLSDIVATYVKHGWILRRVLLSQQLRIVIGDSLGKIFGDIMVVESDLDAAWFSRPPVEGGVPWEIRSLSDFPFALLENIDENADRFEGSLNAVEARLRENIAARKLA